jgi:hypothetical protein
MPWRPIGLSDFEAPTFSGQSAHRWRWGCQPYTQAILVLISFTAWVDSRAMVRLEELGQLKNPLKSGIKSATFRLCSIVPHLLIKRHINILHFKELWKLFFTKKILKMRETWSLTSREQHRLRGVSDKGVMGGGVEKIAATHKAYPWYY